MSAQSPDFAGLEGITQKIADQSYELDPVVRQSIEEATRERLTSQTTQVEQATGLTGAAQVSQSQGAFGKVFAEAFRTAVTEEQTRRQSALQLELAAQGQLSQMQQSAFEFDRNIELQLQMQKEQEALRLKQAIVGGVAGLATAGIGAAFAPAEITLGAGTIIQ